MSTFDRHPYLKHSTAMPFKPAVKATEQPAGQVVNEDKGLSSLSEYIRSINRAQAFDDVAAESKLSFNDWYNSINYQIEDIDFVYHSLVGDLLEEAWNTALTRGKIS